MAEIEQLTIGIEAEAKTANKVVENLSNKIGLLADALNRVDTGKLSGIATGIRKLSDAAVGFKGAKSTELSSLASTLKKFDGIDTNSLYGISSSMNALSDGIKSAQGVDTSGFSNVVSSISKLGGTKATSGTQNLIKIKDDLARFVDGMNRVESLTFDTSNLSHLLSGIKGLGSKASSDATKNLPTISAQFQNFVRQMNKIGSLTFDTSNLSSLISSISKMGGKGVSAAVGNIPKLAEAMKDLMTTLSRAPTVSQNVIDMANALAQLSKAGSGIGTATNSISKMSVTTIRASGKVKNALKGMQGGFRSLLRTLAPLIGAFQLFNFGKQAMEISSDLTEVQNVVDVTFGDFKSKIEDLAKVSITDFGMSELTAKQISSRFQAMGTAMGFAQGEMADMSVNLTKLAADMASFYNVEQEDVARSMQSIFTGETEPLRKYGLDLTQATLQEWAHKQGIDAKMQSMSQMEKTMLRYQYVLANTGAAAKDFQRTSESWANQVRILKQNFEQLASVIGGVLINAFKPVVKAINAAMGAIIAFAKTISNALGQIFGWTYEESGGGFAQEFDNAAAGAGAIEDATGGAADNIKKMQAGLRAFDELKVINMPDNNQGGSGGGGGGTGGAGGGAEAAGGKWVQGESILEKYKSDIDTLYKLGEHIGKTLTDAMNSIDWDSVYQKAEGFGKGLADFLNGLISPELFGATGRTIAGALNTAIHAALAFGETFDWEDFGLSIATGINEFFKTFKFKKLAKTINTWIKGALKTATTMLKKTDFKMIGKKIGEFIKEIDWLGNLKEVGKLIWEAIKAALATWKSAFDAAPIETGILTAVSVLKFTKLGDILTGKINGALSKVKDGLSLQGIATAIAGVFAEFTLVSDAFEGLISGSQGVGSALMEIVTGAGLAVGALKLIGLSNPFTAVIVGATTLIGAIKGINDAQQQTLEKLAEERELTVFGDHLSNITTRLNDAAQATKERMSASIEYVQNAGLGEMQLAKDLADRYFELADKENKTNEETEEMQRLAGLLVEKAPELNQYYDEQTGLINGTRDAINDVIEARLKEIQLNAVSEKLTEAYKERVDVLDRLGEAADTASKAQDEMKRLQSEYNELAKMDKALRAYTEIGELRGKGITQLDDSAKSQDLLNKAIEAGADPTNDLIDLQEQLKEILTANGEELPKTLYEGTVGFSEQMNALQSEIDIFSEDYKNAWNTFEEQKEALETTESTISQLKIMMSDGMDDVGGDFGEGYKNGILSKVAEVESAAKEMGDMSEFSLRESIESHSPSEVTKRIGKDFVDGYNLGISENSASSSAAVSSWMSELTSAFSDFASLTKNAFAESWNGINANNTETWNTMKNTIVNAGNAIRSNITSMTVGLRTSVIDAWNTIKSNTNATWSNIRTLISTSWNNIRTNTSNATNNVKMLVSTSWNNVRTLTSDTWNVLKTSTTDSWNSIKQSVSSSTGNIQSTLQNAMGNAERNWTGHWSSMANTVNNALDGIRSAVSSAMSSISSMISSINGDLDSLFAKAASTSKITAPVKGGIGSSGSKDRREASPRMAIPEVNTAAFENVNIPAFATGGITMKHTFAEIGEYNRPEAILPLTNDRAMGMIAESIYENYNGNADYPKDGYFDNGRMSELISETRRQNRLMEQQNQLLERILGKPTMEIGDVNNALVKYSMERGGNYRGGNMSRLAVAEEVYR